MSKRFSRSEFLFLTAYVLWLLFAAIKLTYLKRLFAFSDINGYVEKAVLVLLLLKLIEDDKYGIRGFIGIAAAIAVYYSSLQAQASGIVIPALFLFSIRNVDYRDVFKVTMAVQLGVMAVSVGCSLAGIIPNEIWDEEIRFRYSLGYTFCTYGSHISLFLTLIYLSLRKRIHLLEAILLILWNVIWYRVTDTRTDLYLCIPAIAGCYLIGRLKLAIHSRVASRLLYMLIGPAIGLGAIVAQWCYNVRDAVWWKLNNALNSRLSLGHDAIEQYGFTLWGQYIKWVGQGGKRSHPEWVYNYVDSSFLKYLLHYGVIFFVLLMVGIILMGRWVADSRNPGLEIAFICWLVYGAIDAELFELGFQPFMLLLGYAFAEGVRYAKKYSIRDVLFNQSQYDCNSLADRL